MDRLARIGAVLAVVLSVVALAVALTVRSDLPEERAAAPPVITRVDGGDADRKQDDALRVPAAAVKQALPGAEEHEGLRDQTPAGAPPAQLRAAEGQRERIRKTQEPLPTAGASQGFPGCATRFVVNQSSRNGVRPQVIVDHYTVSRNLTGTADVNAIVSLFNRPSFSASSHFVIDAEGNCAYIVPIEAKAWTQAAGNPISVSIEVIDMGTESIFLPPAGLMKLVAVHQEIGRRTGIPMRRGAVSGCAARQTGIVQHADFGACGGGHHDIGPFSIAAVVQASARGAAAAAASPVKGLTKREKGIVQKRCSHIAQYARFREGTAGRRTHHRWNVHYQRLAAKEKALLTRLGHYRTRHRGIRRKRMVQAERLSAADRRSLCG